MKAKSNQRLVGMFVIGSVAALVLMFLVYAQGQFLTEKEYRVLYFSGSLSGLQEGAPVKFRGVRVGTVEEIRIEIDHSTRHIMLPVIISIEPKRIIELGVRKGKASNEIMQDLINQGMRAKLAMQSMVTGMLYIEVDIVPDAPIELKGYHPELFEIPTVESKSEKLSDILENAQATISSIREFVTSEKLTQSVHNFNEMMLSGKKMMQQGEELATSANAHIEPIGVKLSDVLHELDDTLGSVRVLADFLARHPESLVHGKKNVISR